MRAGTVTMSLVSVVSVREVVVVKGTLTVIRPSDLTLTFKICKTQRAVADVEENIRLPQLPSAAPINPVPRLYPQIENIPWKSRPLHVSLKLESRVTPLE